MKAEKPQDIGVAYSRVEGRIEGIDNYLRCLGAKYTNEISFNHMKLRHRIVVLLKDEGT